MKKMFFSLCLAALACWCSLTTAFAQQVPSIPVDKAVRIGHLDNGLTYYIRHNAKPEKRAEFFIAQNVGSILEEPDQRGLAHFLEHMCFNGTKNFPGNEKGLGIVPWCESKGIKFGYDLNAYTAVEKTVYNISNVPTTNQAVVDSCLLILHDWSNAVLLEDSEIDKERGVIREEWRSRNSGMSRLYTEAQPTLYPGSKFADCMPIGSIDVINNFKYQTIRDYYEKWYRPDLQAIIVVGDIDVDAMEQKIKETFADVPKPVNPAKRTRYTLDNSKEPLIYIGRDKEVEDPSISIFFKHDATPAEAKQSVMYLAQSYVIGMANTMLNTRLSELLQKADRPFINAGVYYDDYFVSNAKEAFTVGIVAKATGMHTAMNTALTEVERVRRFGFTEGEYQRARANYLQHLETAYNERANTKNGSYAEEYVDHFTLNEPIAGIEFEYTTMSQIANNTPLEVINQTMQQLVTEENQAVFIGAPDKAEADVPTKEEVIAMLKGMKELKLEAYVDKVSNEPLIKEVPKGGKIVSETTDGIYGTTVLKLSNGIEVYIKPTTFKADEIQMRGFSFGGSSLLPDSEVLNGAHINDVMNLGGIGNFSNIDLQKVLAGKRAAASTGVNVNSENVSGYCSPKDFETLMQLTYLRFTAPRQDAEAFASYKNRLKAQLESAESNPMSAFQDTVLSTTMGHHPRYFKMKPEMVEKIDYNRIVEIYKERFADAGDFKFYFVGNIDLATVRPLIEQYLGALPATGRKETYRDNNMRIRSGIISKTFAKEQQTPMATSLMIYSGKCDYTLENKLKLSIYKQILDMIFTEEIREKEGGTYGVSTGSDFDKLPQPEMVLQIMYQTDPAKVEHLNGIIDREMKKFIEQGPDAEKLRKVKEFMLKQYANNQKENNYWIGCLNEYLYNGVDNTLDYEATLNAITPADVQKFAAQLVKQGNKITIVMTVPETK